MSNVEQAYQKVYNTEGSQDELTTYAMKKLIHSEGTYAMNRETLERASLERYGPIVIHGFSFLDNRKFDGIQGHE